MGFIQAFTGSLKQTFADQWKDFYLPQSNVPATAAVFRAGEQQAVEGLFGLPRVGELR